MDFKSLQRMAKNVIDKRGGTEALKADAEELKKIATGPGTASEKAKRAADALKDPGARATDATKDQPVTPPAETPAPPTAATPDAPPVDAPHAGCAAGGHDAGRPAGGDARRGRPAGGFAGRAAAEAVARRYVVVLTSG